VKAVAIGGDAIGSHGTRSARLSSILRDNVIARASPASHRINRLRANALDPRLRQR
jgi:hypothetical protein